ncbi:MAG TPA: glycosyltransferase family 4 protein [Tepidisphaeraceae bacterium]|nr:glycosyltransferase family 4 protein [Tepidisphaeraceae bacterium]
MRGSGMKILMTADTVGGVWTYAIELARALAPHGAQIGLATMGNPLSCEQRRDVSYARNVTLYESEFQLEWMPDPWDDITRAGDWLLDLEARFAPDVVHLNNFAHAALPWEAPVMVVGHSCVLSWWRAVKGEDAPPQWEPYRRAVTRGLHSADLVVAPSYAMMTALERHYAPLPPNRVIHNGRDASRYRAAEKHAYILSAGRAWDEAKNVAALDAVAQDLPWPVLVAGDGVIGENLTALGQLGAYELAEHLAHASIYALPARYEPFGLSVLEAALCGCALVLGDIDSLRELWSDAAIFVPPDNSAALRRALTLLIENYVVRQMLGQRARERAACYTPACMAEAYLAVYRGILTPTLPAMQHVHPAVSQP